MESQSPGGGIGRRKGLKIPRGQPRAGSTPALGIIMKKIVLQVALIIILTSCSKGIIPMPGNIIPERNTDRISKSSFGDYPKEYTKIIKEYLQKNLLNHEDAKVEFINKPGPMSISQMGNDYTGYRLCLSINSKNSKSIYTGYKTHLFVINNSEVKLHLYDSGLLKIPFELCVNVNESNTMYLNEIPDESKEIMLDKMDTIDLKDSFINESDLRKTYISCILDNRERTFYFNEKDNLFVESDGIEEIKLNDIRFSSTHILGYRLDEEILINRVSGTIIISRTDSRLGEGKCELLDEKKF